LLRLLRGIPTNKPVAFVLAGHNGSGKSTLWNEKLSPELKIPLVNADRLTLSFLPERVSGDALPKWAQDLRDGDERWQRISQQAVRTFTSLIMEQRLPFAFETVFSHWERRSDGSHFSSKIDEIRNLRNAGYFVVLLFVGLASAQLSILRVETRVRSGGHTVSTRRLKERYPRTQAAIAAAAPLADLTIMFDNSRDANHAFSLVRAQRGRRILFDCRMKRFYVRPELRRVAMTWLPKVASNY
jgi:predicted ABC-type ATPase